MVVGLHEQGEEMRELLLDRWLEFAPRERNRGAQIRVSKSGEASGPSVDQVGSVLGRKNCKLFAYKRRAALDNSSGDQGTASVAPIWMRSGYVLHAKPGVPIARALEHQRHSTLNYLGGGFIEYRAAGCAVLFVGGG